MSTVMWPPNGTIVRIKSLSCSGSSEVLVKFYIVLLNGEKSFTTNNL